MRPTDALPHPAAWRTTTVRRSVDLTRGVSWSKEQERSEPGPDRIPVIGIKNIQDRLELSDLLYLPDYAQVMWRRHGSPLIGPSLSDQTGTETELETPS